MPIPSDCIRLRYTFDLDSTDIAVMGITGHLHHITGNVIDWQAYMDDAAQKGAQKWVDRVERAPFHQQVVARSCDAYHLSTAGKVLHRGSALFTGPTAWSGAATVPSLPWEVSLCVSVYGYQPGSFVPNARNLRGRFYLPPMSSATLEGPRGHLSAASAAVVQQSMNGLLNDLEGMVLGPAGQGADFFELGIISSSRKADAGYAGQFTRAVVAGFDRRFDSQRRRENADRPAKQWFNISREP